MEIGQEVVRSGRKGRIVTKRANGTFDVDFGDTTLNEVPRTELDAIEPAEAADVAVQHPDADPALGSPPPPQAQPAEPEVPVVESPTVVEADDAEPPVLGGGLASEPAPVPPAEAPADLTPGGDQT